MRNDIPVAKNIDEYISRYPAEIRQKLEAIRKTIRAVAPKAEEVISYMMPAFKQDGMLVYFAAFKHHIGFFPGAGGVEAFKKELTAYKTSKGTIQFPLDQAPPLSLVKKIVQFRVLQNKEKAALKAQHKK